MFERPYNYTYSRSMTFTDIGDRRKDETPDEALARLVRELMQSASMSFPDAKRLVIAKYPELANQYMGQWETTPLRTAGNAKMTLQNESIKGQGRALMFSDDKQASERPDDRLVRLVEARQAEYPNEKWWKSLAIVRDQNPNLAADYQQWWQAPSKGV